MLNDIDFFVGENNDTTWHTLKLKEEEGMYPPKFKVAVSCTPAARQSRARIEFRGAVNDLVFDVSLNPPFPLEAAPTSPTLSSIGNKKVAWFLYI